MPCKPALTPLTVADDERAQLERITNSTTLPSALGRRARRSLASAKGLADPDIGRFADISSQTVGGLASESGSRRFRRLSGNPHLPQTPEWQWDPFFIERVLGITGLYLNPPDYVLVLCVDEKSQTLSLDRAESKHLIDLGHFMGEIYGLPRQYPVTLFTALDRANCKWRINNRVLHSHQAFLAFLRLIDDETPRGLDLHLVLCHSATYGQSPVKEWLAKRQRYHLHCIRTYSSWLDQVEYWFGLTKEQAIQCGTCHSVQERLKQINAFTKRDDAELTPFVWTAIARSIIDKEGA